MVVLAPFCWLLLSMQPMEVNSLRHHSISDLGCNIADVYTWAIRQPQVAACQLQQQHSKAPHIREEANIEFAVFVPAQLFWRPVSNGGLHNTGCVAGQVQ